MHPIWCKSTAALLLWSYSEMKQVKQRWWRSNPGFDRVEPQQRRSTPGITAASLLLSIKTFALRLHVHVCFRLISNARSRNSKSKCSCTDVKTRFLSGAKVCLMTSGFCLQGLSCCDPVDPPVDLELSGLTSVSCWKMTLRTILNANNLDYGCPDRHLIYETHN